MHKTCACQITCHMVSKLHVILKYVVKNWHKYQYVVAYNNTWWKSIKFNLWYKIILRKLLKRKTIFYKIFKMAVTVFFLNWFDMYLVIVVVVSAFTKSLWKRDTGPLDVGLWWLILKVKRIAGSRIWKNRTISASCVWRKLIWDVSWKTRCSLDSRYENYLVNSF